MKVFQIKMKNEFVFYLRDGKITDINDGEYPRLVGAGLFWSKGEYHHNTNDPLAPTKISVPSWRVEKSEIEDCAKAEIPEIIKNSIDMNHDLESTNIIIFIRNIGKYINKKDMMLMGMCAYEGYTDYHNKRLQKVVDRYLNLKGFWN